MLLEFTQLASSFDAGKQELAEIFQRAFEIQVSFETVTATEDAQERLIGELGQSGLILSVGAADVTYVFTLGSQTGLIADWFASDNPTHRNVLSTLAQEVGMTLLPDSFEATEFDAIAVENIALAIAQAEIGDDPQWIGYQAKIGEAKTTMYLAGPFSKIESIQRLPGSEETSTSSAGFSETLTPDRSTAPNHSAGSMAAGSKVPERGNLPNDIDAAIPLLPTYTKSLLRIGVPVTVKLASTKQSVKKVVEMSLGSIIQFEKSCEDPLVLEVAGHDVAFGEAVKVGDKFGLRITSISLPPERFGPIQSIAQDK